MKYTPKRSNHIADAVFTFCFASAAVLFLSTGIVDLYKSIIQFSAVIFLTAGLYILIRFKLVDYNYIIRVRNSDENGYSRAGDFDFVAEKVQGNRINAECRLSIDDLIEIKEISRQEWREYTKKYGIRLKIYHYTVTMYPSHSYLMVFQDNTDTSDEAKIGIIFEPDKKMAEYITALHNEAKNEIYTE